MGQAPCLIRIGRAEFVGEFRPIAKYDIVYEIVNDVVYIYIVYRAG